MRLLPSDLRAVLQSIELLTSDLEPESMPVRTDLAVRSLIPTDILSFEAFGTDNHYNGPLWYSPEEAVPIERLKVIAEHVYEHPLLEDTLTSRRRCGARLSDYTTLNQFKQTVLYNEFFRYLNTDRQLTVGLEVTTLLTITVSLCRLRKDFTGRDCSLIELLTPHLESAFRSSQFVSEIRRRSFGDSSSGSLQTHLAFVAKDFSRYQTKHELRLLFEKYFGKCGDRLPDEVSRYVRHHWQQSVEDFYLPFPAVYVEKPDSTLRIRMRILSALKTIVLFIDETATHLPRFSHCALTEREKEVLSWVAGGKTDGDVADLLSISVRTVQKHLQNIYQKLGVETRTGAVAVFATAIDSLPVTPSSD